MKSPKKVSLPRSKLQDIPESMGRNPAPKAVRISGAGMAKKQAVAPIALDLRNYELTVVVSPVVKAEERGGVMETLKSSIEKFGGTMGKTDEWGLKDLAYAIDHQQSGWYVHMPIQFPATFVAEFDQQLVRDKIVLRHLLVTA